MIWSSRSSEAIRSSRSRMSRAVAASEGAELLVEDMSLFLILPERDRVESLSLRGAPPLIVTEPSKPSSGTPELATAFVMTTFGGGAGIFDAGPAARLELAAEELTGPPARKT